MNLSLLSDSTFARSAPSEGELFVTLFGDARIDLSRAQLPPALRLKVVTIVGDVKLIVPPGTVVEFGGLSLGGERKLKARLGGAASEPGATVRVTGVVLVGDIEVSEAAT